MTSPTNEIATGSLDHAQALLASATAAIGSTVDLGALTDAGRKLLALVGDLPRESNERRAIQGIAHEFIDLARGREVRRAAYPADRGRPGGEWMELVCQLIDASDFHVGQMLRQRVGQYPDKPLFLVPHRDELREWTWREVGNRVEDIAKGLLTALDIEPRVALFTPNRIEGALVDLACLSYGIFVASVPANSTADQMEQILQSSGANLLVVSGNQQVPMALQAAASIPTLQRAITLDPLPAGERLNLTFIDDLVQQGSSIPDTRLEDRLWSVRCQDDATTMYTSGTTGSPKGIRFTQLNLVSKRYCRAQALPAIDENEVFLCFLPLYHTFGRYLEMLGCVHLAATYVFAADASTETIVRHMQQVRPTAFISVPKKWLDLRDRAIALEEAGGLSLQESVREVTGGRLRWGLSAAGRLDPAVFRFFQGHGVDLLSGYGMTEATGGITMTPPGQYVDESIGKALPGIELGFAEDGELLLRGPYVSVGYTDEDDNVNSYRDGWFCTGDIVQADSAGFLRHVDRKKDIYKNARGRTVAPQRVESLFADFPEVARVFAAGDGREYVTLLIRPNFDYPEVDLRRMADPELREYFRGLVATCNRFLAPFERVVNFTLIDRDFSAEMGELTAKGSFRRSTVVDHFREQIESMYESSSIERLVGQVRIRIPIAFLQHLGTTEAGTHAEPDGIVFRAIEKKLHIRQDEHVPERVWIGNCCYRNTGDIVDLDDWLRLPRLWVGNAELTAITGPDILLWTLSRSDRSTAAHLVSVSSPSVPIDEWRKRFASTGGPAASLLSVHTAAVLLSAGRGDEAISAVDNLVAAMTAGRVSYQDLAETHLRIAANHPDEEVRGRAFVALYDCQTPEHFAFTAPAFCNSLLPFLGREAVEALTSREVDPQKWNAISSAFAQFRVERVHEKGERATDFVVALLDSLGELACRQDSYFLPVRRELMAWLLAPVNERIHRTAESVLDKTVTRLRQRFATRTMQTLDPESGLSFTWGETLQFEDGIDPGELARIRAAMQDTGLIAEAVYLLHQGRTIDLDDLAPASIWVSLTATRFGRSVYHVGVRLRNRERVDFCLYVNSAAPKDAFLTDLRLKCVAAGGPGESPLSPQLGGYWPEYDLATVEFIPAEGVETMVRHMHEHPDKDVQQRLRKAWRHVSWSALTAAFDFYRRTEGRWMLAGSITRDVTVALNDFDERTRILPAAGWRPFESALDLLQRIRHGFLDRVRFHFPTLGPNTEDEILFAATIEGLGRKEGLAFLQRAVREAERVSAPSEETRDLAARMKRYVEEVEDKGYMPRALYFAIQRFHAWARQVPDAGVHARAAQLQELKKNYRIEDVARRFPGSRLWLFADTVLKDAPPEGQRTIRQAIRRLRDGASIKDVLGRLYAELKETLPSHDQQYFLTRAAYPHLVVDDRAELIHSGEIGEDRAELVTRHADRLGREFEFRPAANSREVDTLNRIFYTGGIGGGLTATEKLLVAVDPAGYVIGGVGFVRRTPAHVILDKIAVLPRNRGRGIGQILLMEFLQRQAAEGVSIVSAEFIRASWLEQFGFHSHPRYPGVVLDLHKAEPGGRKLPVSPPRPMPDVSI